MKHLGQLGWKTWIASASLVLAQAMSAHAAASLCNGPPNGILDGNEQCETGPCCTSKCELKSASTVCRASTDAVCDPAETCGEQTPAVEAACPADTFADDGTACDDGLFCTAEDACTSGVCTGSGDTCDDGNACTTDTCDEKKNSCGHGAADDGTPCDDGNACTTDDTCSAGICSGTAKTCDDGNACTDDSCDAETGECVSTNNTAPCDDGLFCTSDDVCADGACVGGPATSCDDGNACTTDSCDEENDQCTHGTADDGTACDDGLFCTTNDSCVAGVCTGGAPLDCSDGNDCTIDSCNEGSNSCKYTKAQNGTACEDGSACTSNDVCNSGVCVGGAPTVCNDDNLCTDDSCDDASGGCVFTPNNVHCDDGLFCTVGDTCSGGACVGGAPRVCDDGNDCTTDSCNEDTDSCAAAPVDDGATCDDHVFCTVGETCHSGVCGGGTPNPCDDDNQCTADSCNVGQDVCKNTPMNNNEPCEDGSWCTVNDGCHAGVCTGQARSCDDANVCTDDTCNEGADSCEHSNNTAPCDDGVFCTTGDTCSGGTCSVNTPTCDDKNACTTDSCDEAAKACTNTNNTDPCDDGQFCTVNDACANGACAGGPARNCSDNNDCTTDSCDETADACVNANNTNPCDDGLFCTTGDTCANGACSGTARNCSDNNDCTTDSCDETADACVNANNTNPCDDGLFCTTGDACSNGACVGGSGTPCDDSNVCTTDSCDEAADSCGHTNNTDPCEDGLFCTVGDTCSNGTCASGAARNCSDNNDCTTDSCDEAADACVNANNTNACDDGLFCTVNDACSGGTCTGAPRSCSDSDPCTTDSCDESADECTNVENPSCGTTTTTIPQCPVCGNYNNDDCVITATDALGVLQAAVGLVECSLEVCDWNGSGAVTSIDALGVLRNAVGLPSVPHCPEPPTTTIDEGVTTTLGAAATTTLP